MAKVPRMFLDDLLQWYDKPLSPEEIRTTSEHAKLEADGSDAQVDPRLEARLREKLRPSLEASTLVLLNGAIVDSLYFLDQSQVDYDSLNHLPFDPMFLELGESVPFEIEKGIEAPLKGILFGRAEQSPIVRAYGKSVLDQREDMFYAGVFFDGMNRFDFPTSVIFGSEDLKKGDGAITKHRFTTEMNSPVKVTDIPYSSLIDLCVNIITYINAHNVTIIRSERETRNIGRINRKRARKGHQLVQGLKPVHWIDIKRSTVYTGKGEGEGNSSGMDYREIVRGHFQRYHTNEGPIKLWRNPFVRGPADAQWKDNRYRLLDRLLKTEKPFDR